MERKKFLNFLTDENDNSYFVQNGVVQKHAQATPLENSPDGWKDHQIKVARNTTYYGLFRTFSLPLKFVKSAAKIVRDRLYKYGVEDVLFYKKLKLNTITGEHQLMYSGELDLTTTTDASTYIECTSIDGGINKILKANESTNYEIELIGKGVSDLYLDTCELQQNAFYVKAGESTFGSQNLNITLISLNEKNTINSKTQDFIQINSFADLYNTDYYFNKTTNDTYFNFDFNLELSSLFLVSTPYTAPAIWLYGFDKNNNKVVDVKLGIGIITNVIVFIPIYTINGFKKNIFIPKDTRLYLCVMPTDGTNAFFDQVPPFNYIEDTDLSSKKYFINVEYNYVKQPTICKIITAIELGNRLVQKMANDTNYKLVSTLLNNTSIYLTSGDAIRGFDNAKIKTNFKDFFTSFNRNLCIGLDTGTKTIYIEKRETFYDKNTLIYNLGDVKNVQVKPTNDLFFKKLKIGYTEQNYDDLNGRDEFNTTYEFATLYTKSKKDLDITAPYRADMYGVTFTQINLEGKKTQDNGSDNDVFMLDIDTLNTIPEIVNYETKTLQYNSFDAVILKQIGQASAAFTQNSINNELTFNGVAQNISFAGIVATTNAQAILDIYVNNIHVNSFPNSGGGMLFGGNINLNTGDVIKFVLVSSIPAITLTGFTVQFDLTINFTKRLYRFPNQSSIVTGLKYPASAFNIRLSPKRCLYNHGAWLRGIMQPYDSSKITFQTSTKNTIIANGIDERTDVTIGNLDINYFLPFYVQFETIVPQTLWQTINNNGLKGFVQFNYKGNTYKGYIIDAAQKPADDESQTFNLLLTYDNNLNNLIN